VLGRAAAGLAFGLAAILSRGAVAGADPQTVERGEYLFHASLCAVCHTAEEGAFLAGGRPLESPFGTFYTTNITPHDTHGIGGWSDAQFLEALRQGIAPDGSHYYPAFPYTAYTKLTNGDILAIKAYLDTVEPVDQSNREHDLVWFAWRWPMALWKWLYFEPGPLRADPSRSEQWNRGAYLVEAAAHCAECHSPRNLLGAIDPERRYAGDPQGPEGDSTPNLTSHKKQGIGTWNLTTLSFYLEIGMTPDGDFAGGLMAKVIDKGTGKLTDEDRKAIATYILSLPALAGE